jgi:hypothetical protein
MEQRAASRRATCSKYTFVARERCKSPSAAAARLGLPFTRLWERPLHAIDCQGLFCETNKYCREAAPELASARKRFKARFTPIREPSRLFFPPKWGINGRLPAQPVFSDTAPAEQTQATLF